ncbi:MAG: FAD-binding protein [Atribacterota bacterium]|nr:FAD-binding protein [Atribacterota bacterium]
MGKKENDFYSSDVLIIGGGLAGLRAALSANKAGAKVILVTKGKGASPEIMGFNAPVGLEDSEEVFFNDIVKSGLDINNKKLAMILATESIKAVRDLEDLGIVFDKKESEYDLLQPLGCTYPRLVHHKCLTGAEAADIMMKKAKSEDIQIIKDTMIMSLLVYEGNIVGAVGINMRNGNYVAFQSKAIVLAAGGCGRLYPFTSYPADISSDGYAMAYQENLEFIDMEFIQFEPCGFVYPSSLIGNVIPTTLLIAGGVLKNSKGERFMLKYNKEQGEKVQKNELSHAMYQEIVEGRATKHGGLYYDVSMLPRDLIVRNHSIFYGPAVKAGIDITKEPAEVAPIAHTALGGIIINEECETSLKGLYAAGEVAGGVHGANRLGGNSGTETLVFGARAGFYSAKYAISENFNININIFNDMVKEKISETELFRNNDNDNINPSIIRKELHSVMSKAGNILRNENQLKDALKKLDEIQSMIPNQYAENTKQLLEVIKNNNMISIARIIISAALTRSESRGAHFREDFPYIDDKKWLKNIIITKRNNSLEPEIKIRQKNI